MVLDFIPSLLIWRSVNYYALYFIFVPFAFFSLFGGGKLLKGMERKRNAVWEKKEGEREEENKRVAFEEQEEAKRVQRGEGVPSLGMDVEELFAEEDADVVKEKTM